MDKLISVIVPVYNVEKYVEKCIDSLLVQTYGNIEIILVDDGSTDSSMEICKRKSVCDKRIYLISQKNKGVACARNKGLSVASGDYYAFVDSDDALQEDYFEKLIKCIDGTDYDLCVCTTHRFCNDDEIDTTAKNRADEVQNITPRDAQKRGFVGPDAMIWMTVWGKLFTKSVISDTRFLEGRIYEDAEFVGRIYEKAQKIAFIDNPLYFYRINLSGIMHSRVTEKNFDVIKLHEEYAQRFEKKGDMELYKYSRIRFFEVIKQLFIQANRTKADEQVIERFSEVLLGLFDEMKAYDKSGRFTRERALFVKNKGLYLKWELIKGSYTKACNKVTRGLKKLL